MNTMSCVIRNNFTLFSLVVTLVAMLVVSEVVFLHATAFDYQSSEQSIIELSQDAALTLIIVIAGATAYCNRAWRELFVVIAAVAVMMLIREQNNWFKGNLFSGAWQLGVLSVLLLLGLYLIPRFKHFSEQMVSICQNRYAATGFIGLFILLVFSRLFGRKVIWEGVLGNNFIYSAKMVIEESIELLGYSLILVAVIKLALYVCLNVAEVEQETSPNMNVYRRRLEVG